MSTDKKRRITDPGKLWNAVYDDTAKSLKMNGHDWEPLGVITAAVRVDKNSFLMIFNSTGAVLFYKVGPQGVTVPTDAANGIPVAAGEKFVFSSGETGAWVIGSAAGLYIYKTKEDAPKV